MESSSREDAHTRDKREMHAGDGYKIRTKETSLLWAKKKEDLTGPQESFTSGKGRRGSVDRPVQGEKNEVTCGRQQGKKRAERKIGRSAHLNEMRKSLGQETGAGGQRSARQCRLSARGERSRPRKGSRPSGKRKDALHRPIGGF